MIKNGLVVNRDTHTIPEYRKTTLELLDALHELGYKNELAKK